MLVYSGHVDLADSGLVAPDPCTGLLGSIEVERDVLGLCIGRLQLATRWDVEGRLVVASLVDGDLVGLDEVRGGNV